MPKHLDEFGQSVSYHPIIIRFTSSQYLGLQSISKRSGKPVNEMVRMIVEKHLDLSKITNGS